MLQGRADDASRLAMVPLCVEAVVVALLVLTGAFPAGASGAAAGAVFPADVFFDLERSLAHGRTWPWVAIVLCLSVVVRSGVFSVSFWLAGGRERPLLRDWTRMAGIAVLALAALLPSVVLMTSGTAIRYAPFVFVGAAVGIPTAAYLARLAFRVAGTHAGPGLGAWLGYGYLIALTGLLREWTDAHAPSVVVALVVAALGPVHAFVFLRWTRPARPNGAGGRAALAASLLAAGAFAGAVGYDRYLGDLPRPEEVSAGRVFLLGGVDSTSETGALSDLDVRALGFRPSRAIVLSYRGADVPYTAVDTHQDLDLIARRVAAQIEAEPGDVLLGHSQAALILDRMLAQGASVPERIATISPPPNEPPDTDLPPPGRSAPGTPAADLDRILVDALDAVGAPTYDASVPASPVNLETLIVPDAGVDRLAVWALGDSVWLDGDWRRPGETNVVSISDHVGAVTDQRTVELVRRSFAGRQVSSDDSSWRSILVDAIRYTFEPWRP